MDPRGPEKKERLLAALEKGMVMVHLDARRPGVVVPPQLRGEAHLRLNLSYRFDPPDLSVSEWGVRQTLSFSGTRTQVAIPWSALFAVTSHATREFWMFPDDLPPELLQAVAAPAEPQPQAAPKPALREVPQQEGDLSRDEPVANSSTDASPEPASSPASSDDDSKQKRRAHLRVVK